MQFTEIQIDRWLERGGKFFKAVSRNPVVRGTLLSRGLTDEELAHGWQLYSELHGFGARGQTQTTTKETAAALAINAIDAWDAPAYSAAHAVLDKRYPQVSAFLFEKLEAAEGVATVAGVERFLDRVAELSNGTAPDIDPQNGREAVELLAIRRIVDATKTTELRQLIATAHAGARPNEVVVPLEADPHREQAAENYIQWLNEWREVARVAIARRDYRISLGLAQRRTAIDETDDTNAVPATDVTASVTRTA